MVIVGKGYDKVKKMDFYYFYEVATKKESEGKSRENKLWINTNENLIKGNVSTNDKENYYIITSIRKNKGKEYDL
jgi:hypothetical protein